MTDMDMPLPEPAAHMYPSDLERFQTNETFATAYSVAVGNPDERSVPLLTLSDCVAYAAAEVAKERERAAKVCEDAMGKIFDYHEPGIKRSAQNVCENLAAAIRAGSAKS